MKDILYKIKHLLITTAKYLWNLNWEAKLGLIFLIPPFWGVIIFILNIFGSCIGFEYFPESWNCISDFNYGYDSDSYFWGDNNAYGWGYGWAYGYAATPAIPLYLGLMAIAGAYLVKGNLTKQDK